MSENLENEVVTATEVAANARMKFLPSKFGRHFLRAEVMVFDWAARLSVDYSGGSWHFYELSNGGFYLAPASEPLRVQWDLNHFDALLGADAFGIVVSLFALCHLAEVTGDDHLVNSYHLLRDYVDTHAEADLIWRAID